MGLHKYRLDRLSPDRHPRASGQVQYLVFNRKAETYPRRQHSSNFSNNGSIRYRLAYSYV